MADRSRPASGGMEGAGAYNRHAALFRATFVPSLAAALSRADEPEARRAFGDRLERGLKQRLLREPTPTNSRVDAVVVAKLPAAQCRAYSRTPGKASTMPTTDQAMMP